MKQKYELIIFDLDGTLIDSLPYHFLAFKDLLLEHGIKINDDYLKKLIGMPTADILQNLQKKFKFSENVQDLREERRFHYFKFLGNRDIVFPGVKETLTKMNPHYKLAVATGSSKIIFSHSTDREFQKIFDLIVTINNVKKGKPHPAQFILAAKKMRVKPKECVIVGDSIYDVLAAKRARMDFIGVTTGYNSRRKLVKYGATKVVDSVKELGKVL